MSSRFLAITKHLNSKVENNLELLEGLAMPGKPPKTAAYPDDEWVVTHTVHPHRMNIFQLSGEKPYHVGTIVSGSLSQKARFDKDVKLISMAPAILSLLIKAAEETSDKKLKVEIASIVARLDDHR